MKKLIPYILSYFIVATCVVVYERITVGHMRSSSSQYVIVDSALSHDELTVKLKQAGLPEASEYILKPATLYAVVYRFAFLAVFVAAFAGLAYLLRRALRTDISNHSHDV